MDIPIISIENSTAVPLSKRLLKKGSVFTRSNKKTKGWERFFGMTRKQYDKSLWPAIFDDEKSADK